MRTVCKAPSEREVGRCGMVADGASYRGRWAARAEEGRCSRPPLVFCPGSWYGLPNGRHRQKERSVLLRVGAVFGVYSLLAVSAFAGVARGHFAVGGIPTRTVTPTVPRRAGSTLSVRSSTAP